MKLKALPFWGGIMGTICRTVVNLTRHYIDFLENLGEKIVNIMTLGLLKRYEERQKRKRVQ
jgi:hypothetical protein